MDESMIKYKGHVGDNVCMPRKPVKQGFKVWRCSYSCCGYLCTFQIYHGAPTSPVTREKTQEKGLAKRVAGDLVAPFKTMLFIVIISILVVHLSKRWPVNKYSLPVLLKNVPRVFLLVSKILNHLEAHTCLKR